MKANITCSDYPDKISSIVLSTADDLGRIKLTVETVLVDEKAVQMLNIEQTNITTEGATITTVIQIDKQDTVDFIEAVRNMLSTME